MRRLRAFPGFVLFTVLCACTGCGFFVDQQVTSVQVTPGTTSVQAGGTVALTAMGVNNTGTTSTLSNVNWTSSAPQIATVSSTGVVTGVTAGTATITATSGSVSGTATVTVGTTGSGALTIVPANQTVSVTTGAVQFTATSNGQDVTASTTWTSSNPAVGQFGGVGVGQLTLIGQGTTTITANSTVNGATQTGTTTLTVGP